MKARRTHLKFKPAGFLNFNKMLTYIVTDQKKFSKVEDIEINTHNLIWAGQFIGDLKIYLENGTVDIFEQRLYSIKHFIEDYGFIISEE